MHLDTWNNNIAAQFLTAVKKQEKLSYKQKMIS